MELFALRAQEVVAAFVNAGLDASELTVSQWMREGSYVFNIIFGLSNQHFHGGEVCVESSWKAVQARCGSGSS